MKESKLAIILALAALDDSEIKSLEERVNELAELGFKPEIVDELPEEGNDHTLYLVPQSEPGEDPWYKEYLWLDNEWENIGTTSINFDNYELTSNKVTTLSAQSTDTQYPSAKAVFDNFGKFEGFIGDVSAISGQFNFSTAKRGLYINYTIPYHFNYTIDGTTSHTYNGRVMFLVINKEFSEASNDTVIGYTFGATINNDGHFVVSIIKKVNATTISFTETQYNPTADKGFLLWFLTGMAQTIYGVKTFNELPIATSTPTQDGQLTNKKYVDDQISDFNIQYNIMPVASASNENQIIEYTGTTDANYTQGYFYKCVSDGQPTPTYNWERINVQPNRETLVIDIGNRTIDELVAIGPFDHHTSGMAELFNQLENFAEAFYNCGGNVNVRVINNSGDEYVAQLVRYSGVYEETFVCYFDLIGFNGTYSLCRDEWCASGGPSYWEFSPLTIQEFTNHKVNEITENNTNNQYPSAKAVWDLSVKGMDIFHVTNGFFINFFTARKGLYVGQPGMLKMWGNRAQTSGYNTMATVFGVAVLYNGEDLLSLTNDTIVGFAYGIDTTYSSALGGISTYPVTYHPASDTVTVNWQPSNLGYIITGGTQTFYGSKTFQNIPSTAGTPTQNKHLTTKLYVDNKISSAIASLETLKRAIVETLPVTDIDPNTIYMVLKTTPGLQNVYDEWMYINNEWELIGSTEVDLTNYLAKDNTTAYTPNGEYNPSTKGYVDNYFFQGEEEAWNLLTPQQQAAYAVAVVEYGLYDLTEEDENNLSSILGSDETIISDITEEEGIEITNQIIGGND